MTWHNELVAEIFEMQKLKAELKLREDKVKFLLKTDPFKKYPEKYKKAMEEAIQLLQAEQARVSQEILSDQDHKTS